MPEETRAIASRIIPHPPRAGEEVRHQPVLRGGEDALRVELHPPSIGNDRCRTPMIAPPSSLVAVTARQSGTDAGSMTREW